MAIQKMTWQKMLETHRPTITTITNDILTINENYRKAMGLIFNGSIEKPDLDYLQAMIDQYLGDNPDTNVWSEIPIFLSTLKIKNVRVYYELFDELKKKMQYVISLCEGYKTTSETSGTSVKKKKETGTLIDTVTSTATSSMDTSDTPQIDDDDFSVNSTDYRSGMTRGKDTDDSTRDSSNTFDKSEDDSHTLKVSSVKFKELKDLDLEKIKNDITDFIFDIPKRIYNYYSLDTTPGEELRKMIYEY